MTNIYYRIMQLADINAAAKCLSAAFTQSEPMTAFLKITDADFTKFATQVCHNIVRDQLSIIAETTPGNIVGVRLCGIYSRYAKPLILPESMQPICAILDALHTELVPFPIEHKSIHLKMLGVNAAFRNDGIAQRLLFETFKNAKKLGFEYVIVEASNKITQHIFINKFQFHFLNKIKYQTFSHQDQLIFQQLQHEEYCTLLGKNLRDFNE